LEQADFIHLVRLSEHASAENSKAYRRSVAAFAALGYAWVVGCLLLAAAILAWTVVAAARGHFKGFHVALLLGAGGLLVTSLRALWCRLDEPQGMEVTRTEAPALFDALDRIRSKIKGPAIDRVLLDGEFNASIRQLPRWGLFGGARNYLTIGLPLLFAVDRPRFLAVLAHEYGHLRGDHGRFAAWIYRTRQSWASLHHGLSEGSGPAAAATQAFLRWYFPRFSARTFALARQDEYEADRISGQLLGKQVTAAALTEIAIKGAWLGSEFWRSHWAMAATSEAPVGPYGAMRTMLGSAPPPAFAGDALRRVLRQISDTSDTHPVLRDRLEALDAARGLPAWSSRQALDLLGALAAKAIGHFDREWCKANAGDWKQHRAYLGRVRQRAEALAASGRRPGADELVELGDLLRRLDERSEARAHYERALRLAPGHAAALRGLAECLPAADRELRLGCLERLHEASAPDRWWASRTAVAALEQPGADGGIDDKALKLWRERLRDAGDAEQRAWDEIAGTPFFEAIARHGLGEFEHGELRATLARRPAVARAWLVRKLLREFPDRRSYLLFLELPGLPDEDRHDLCREMEAQLDLPGQVLALWAGHSPTLAEIERNAFEPVYQRIRA
jgi:tetratricopeptide (TPR) repeat protein